MTPPSLFLSEELFPCRLDFLWGAESPDSGDGCGRRLVLCSFLSTLPPPPPPGLHLSLALEHPRDMERDVRGAGVSYGGQVSTISYEV